MRGVWFGNKGKSPGWALWPGRGAGYPVFRNYLFRPGRSAAVAHLVWDQGVVSSNLTAPTKKDYELRNRAIKILAHSASFFCEPHRDVLDRGVRLGIKGS
jgi:hypothetical protein